LAGQVLAVQSVGILLSMILAGRLFNHVESRTLIAIGCVITGMGVWDMTNFYPQMGFWQAAWPGFLRGLGSGLLFVPMSTLCLGAVPKEQVGNASALFNMVRSLGGGMGLAMMTSFMSQGAQIHQTTLVSHVHPYNPALWQAWNTSGSMFGDGGTLQGEAFLGLLYGEVQRQALALAMIDNFRLMAYILFGLIPVIFLMRRAKTVDGVMVH
jgi:MFS transporter, DHA2 family, multidrug resistance protein